MKLAEPSEAVQAKALRYIADGRVTITSVHRGAVFAEVKSETAPGAYQTGYALSEGLFCTCAARRVCAHLAALMLLVRPGAEQ